MKTLADDRAILDTNVLVYAADVRAPQYNAARTLRDAAARGEFKGYITTQVLLEFVSVVTSSKRVTSPRSIAEAWTEVRRLTTAFPVLALQDDDIRTVGRLSEMLNVKGADIFDLAIAATAFRAGIYIIYSFDTQMFSRIPGLEVRVP
jgi:predicted nucleic acid-binding protein